MRASIAARFGQHVAALAIPHAPGEADGDDASAPGLAGPWRTTADLAATYPALLDPSLRKRRGAWFTPSSLAAPTAARALAPLLDAPAALRILDPAVGGGTFLLAAFDALVAAGLRPRDAALRLHGLDVDGTAAALAALALWERCGDDAPPLETVLARVRSGDGLREPDDCGFDAVLTNPPWETLQSSPAARADAAALRPRFRHQGGGKLFTYRLFVERCHDLLRPGGRFGLVVPASLWFDRDAQALRQLLFDGCEIEWLYGFENQKRIFAIDSRYRFSVVVGRRGGSTASLRAAFGRVDVADWQKTDPVHVRYPRELLAALSPCSHALLEIDEDRDLAVLQRMVRAGRPLIGRGGAFVWRQGDHNMTSDRDRFVLRSDAEAAGFRRGADGVWRRGAEELLPLYQGAMVYDLHPNAGAYRSGAGRATTWEEPRTLDELRPLYLVPRSSTPVQPARIVLRALSNATNERTAVACLLPDVPCGNSLGVLTPQAPTATPLRTMAAGAAVLGSLAFDWALRLRLSGTNLNGFLLADCLVPKLDERTEARLANLALQLCAILPWHTPLWAVARDEGWLADDAAPARTDSERRPLLTAIDALAGRCFGLDAGDVAWITRGCDLPAAQLRARSPAGVLPRGFWRVDRTLPPGERRPGRWLAAAQKFSIREDTVPDG